MFINDYPLSLYDEETVFIVHDYDDPERFSTPEEAKEKADLKRFLALMARD
jgi:hypothetical protein